jgi:hypothetical protein
MSEMFLVAVTHVATRDTTPTVFEHRRRHLFRRAMHPALQVAAGIIFDHPDRRHLRDGVPIRDHHAARSIRSLFP